MALVKYSAQNFSVWMLSLVLSFGFLSPITDGEINRHEIRHEWFSRHTLSRGCREFTIFFKPVIKSFRASLFPEFVPRIKYIAALCQTAYIRNKKNRLYIKLETFENRLLSQRQRYTESPAAARA